MSNVVIAQILTTLLAFTIFFLLAKRLFWGPIMQMIDDRQLKIRSEFDRIDSMQRQVEALQSDYAKRMADIEAEARQKMQETINQGREIAEQIADQARRDTEALQERTKQTLAIEIDKARAELKQDVVRMTLTATEKIMRQRMDSDREREMVSSFVEELARK